MSSPGVTAGNCTELSSVCSFRVNRVILVPFSVIY